MLKHPATLILRGMVVAENISFAAACKLAKERGLAPNVRGLDRARVNFYAGKVFAFCMNTAMIVPSKVVKYPVSTHIDPIPNHPFPHMRKVVTHAIPARVLINGTLNRTWYVTVPSDATRITAALYTGDWIAFSDVLHKLSDRLDDHVVSLIPNLVKRAMGFI